jgi:hypothetical protein
MVTGKMFMHYYIFHKHHHQHFMFKDTGTRIMCTLIFIKMVDYKELFFNAAFSQNHAHGQNILEAMQHAATTDSTFHQTTLFMSFNSLDFMPTTIPFRLRQLNGMLMSVICENGNIKYTLRITRFMDFVHHPEF